MKTDRLRRFTLEHQGIRGSLVRIPETWQCIRERGAYAPAVGRILGHAVVAAALIGKNLKFDGRLTLQLQGNGPLHLLVVQCTHDLGIRGLAKCRETQLVEFRGLVQPGRMTVTVESGAKQERYQSIIPVEQGSLAECLGAYYQDSVQLPTAFWLDVDDQHASGLMLQRLPGNPAGNSCDWDLVIEQAGKSLPASLAGQTDEALLTRVFDGELLRVFKPQEVAFQCSCSDDGMRRMLRLLGADELHDIVAEQGRIEVRCEFCNRGYTVAANEIPGLVHGMPDAGATTLH